MFANCFFANVFSNASAGHTAHFEVSLTTKPSLFCWLKDNKAVDFDSRIESSFSDEKHEYKLIIKDATVEDSGTYTAVATSATGNTSCSAKLTVHES